MYPPASRGKLRLHLFTGALARFQWNKIDVNGAARARGNWSGCDARSGQCDPTRACIRSFYSVCAAAAAGHPILIRVRPLPGGRRGRSKLKLLNEWVVILDDKPLL